MADTETPLDPATLFDVEFQFQASEALHTRVAILRPGKCWSAVVGWQDVAADGHPTEGQLFVPVRYSDVGPNSDLWSVMLRVVPEQTDGALLRIYATDATGRILSSLGWYTMIDAEASGDLATTARIVTNGLGGKYLITGGMAG